MPYVARPLRDAGLQALGEDAAAVRTGHARLLLARRVAVGRARLRPGWQLCALHHCGDRIGDQLGRNDCIDHHVSQGAGRHPGIQRILRVLHDRGPACGLDHRQPCSAVVARPR